jgi:uncharacterized protein (DUF885 family)
MYRILIALLGVAVCACGNDDATRLAETPAVSVPTRSQIELETARLDEWFDARFEESLGFSPIRKTMLGRKDDYDRIDDLSEAAQDEQHAWSRASVAELEQTFDYELLTPEARLSYDLWLYQHEQSEAALQFRRHGYLFHQMRGSHVQLPQLMITAHRVDTESDMVAYIARIGEIGRAVGQVLERARLAADEGVRVPRYSYEAVIEQARALITGAPFDAGPAAPLLADAIAKIEALIASGVIDASRAAALRADAEAALVDRFAPAYRALIAWAESELPLTDEIATGVWKLPQGAAYYEERLAAMTTTDMTADEIHELGLREVARIHAEMETIRENVGFDGDLQAFFAFVRDDPQFYYPSTDEGRQAYLDTARRHLEFIEARLPDYFGLLPKASLEVRRVEPFREVAGQAQHYQRGTPDGSRPGIYYAHLIDMGAMPIPMMEVIAYHEGLPGHHMQLSIAQELTGLPTFRTLAGFTAFSEGWGLYAEALAKEIGAYEDPYSDFGRLTSEIWRAIRLVVDTGLHAKGWTEAEAVEYMQANSAIAAGQIRSEVRRYIVMPGQATAYKIGMIKIQELRARSEATLGEAFDIREFHDVVLGSGGLPLTLLERRVDEWIAVRRSR